LNQFRELKSYHNQDSNWLLLINS